MTPTHCGQEWNALFHPHDPESFLGAVRDHRRLLIRTDQKEKLSSLLSWSMLNQLITLDDLVSGKTRLMRQNRPVPLEMISSIPRHVGHRMLFPDTFQALCERGVSLVFNSIDEQVPQISTLTAMIERHMRSRTHTNAYASFQKDSAFGAHFDAQNVLIIQLQGRKHWWCHGPLEDWPLLSRNVAASELPPTEWEGILEPGDLLFVPRGDIHRTQVEGESSLHLTVTMVPPTGKDVVEWLAQRAAASDPLMREDIPTHDDDKILQSRAEELKTLLHRHIDALDLSEFLLAADRRRSPIRPFTLGLDSEIRSQTFLSPTLRRRIVFPKVTSGDTTIAIEESVFNLTISEADVLSVLMERDGMTLGELELLLPRCNVLLAASGLARKSLVLPYNRR